MTNRFLWTIRRELWENRWLWLAPLAIAAVLLFASVSYEFREETQRIVGGHVLPDANRRQLVAGAYDVVSGIMMGIGLLVAAIYCVDALYGERRDRSVLLWKSLPVSDLETVLAKLAIPTLVLPLITWVLTIAVQLVMLLASSALLAAHGGDAARLWSDVAFVPNAFALLYHLVALHGIATAPIYAWLLLVSAWAPRAPLAWAILPPAAIMVLERVAFGTSWLADLLVRRLGGGAGSNVAPPDGRMMPLMNPTLPQLLVAPAFWAGLIVAALFVLAATRVRRSALPA